jgi:hypothetical protein
MRRNRLAFSLARVALACAGWLAVACVSVSGRVRAEGGPGGDWTLRPNRCKVGSPTPAWGGAAAGVVAASAQVADLYYAGTKARDTEVVVDGADDPPALLVRIPGAAKMVVLRRSDCTVFDISTGYTSYTVNDEAGLTGTARFDCERPEVGHVQGKVSFTCF